MHGSDSEFPLCKKRCSILLCESVIVKANLDSWLLALSRESVHIVEEIETQSD
jgi:hypothetical protein